MASTNLGPVGGGNVSALTAEAGGGDEAIAEIVRGLGPVDWVQVQLLADLPPARRIVPAMRARAFALAALRGAWRKRYQHLTETELTMKVLAHFTPIRMAPR